MKRINTITEKQWDKAVTELSVFITDMANKCLENGWRYYTTSNAPESWAELKRRSEDKCIPIANYGSDSTIYNTSVINMLFRFWHDVTHLENDLSFSYEAEKRVAELHYEEGKQFGLSSLALSILWADTYGQVKYYFRNKKFVDNQKDFVYSCVTHGIDKTCKINF